MSTRRKMKAALLGKKPRPVHREPEPVWVSPLCTPQVYAAWAEWEALYKTMLDQVIASFGLPPHLLR